MGTMYKHSTGLLLPLAGKSVCEQLEKAKKSRAVRGNREKRSLVVPEMCEGCTAYMGEGYRCPVQKEPGWLWIHKKECWSKRTDPAVDRQIEADIENYRNRMGER
jgi:hypothetical protein